MIPGVLVLYHRHAFYRQAATVYENIDAYARHSCFPVWSINTELGLPEQLPSMRFAAVLLHYTVFARGHEYELSPPFLDYLAGCAGSLKIAVFQDEYRNCPKRFEFVNDYEIDVVYTLLEPEYHDEVYGKYTDASRIVYHIPGYVDSALAATAARFSRPIGDREIDVGYRARQLPYYMGRGAQEKRSIAGQFASACEERGLKLKLDIVSDRRLYGDNWSMFMANCKSMLGVEAGVSIFDLDGTVQRRCEEFLAQYPAADFESISARILHEHEDNIPYRTISPRHFEAAAFRTCQILFEGNYSGILEPGKHYIPLRKDFSNFDDVISQFTDSETRDRISETAYQDLIESGRYSYEGFVRAFDQLLSRLGIDEPGSTFDKEKIELQLHGDLTSRRRWAIIKALPNHFRQMNFPGRAVARRIYRSLKS